VIKALQAHALPLGYAAKEGRRGYHGREKSVNQKMVRLMEVWWIVFGVTSLVFVLAFWLYRGKMTGEVATLKADHRQNLQVLEQESEKRVLRIERASALEKSRAEHHLIRDLMPLADALDRALEMDGGADSESIRQGIELVSRELAGVFKRHGVEKLEPQEGEGFDPALHEAVEQRIVNHGLGNQVVQCFRSGYRQGDDVLRPAMVAVSTVELEAQTGPDDPSAEMAKMEVVEPEIAQAD